MAFIDDSFQSYSRAREASSFKFGWTSVSKAGNVAYVASEITAYAEIAGQESVFPWRLTAVLDNRENEWLIYQLHLSAPASGQDEGKSWSKQQS